MHLFIFDILRCQKKFTLLFPCKFWIWYFDLNCIIWKFSSFGVFVYQSSLLLLFLSFRLRVNHVWSLINICYPHFLCCLHFWSNFFNNSSDTSRKLHYRSLGRSSLSLCLHICIYAFFFFDGKVATTLVYMMIWKLLVYWMRIRSLNMKTCSLAS